MPRAWSRSTPGSSVDPPLGDFPRDDAADRDGPSRLEHARLRLAYARQPAPRRPAEVDAVDVLQDVFDLVRQILGFPDTKAASWQPAPDRVAMWMRVNAFILSRSIFGSSSTTIVTTASPSRAHCRRNVGEASHTRRTSGPSSLETASGDVNPGPAGRQPLAIAGGALTALGLRAPRYSSPAPRVPSGGPAADIDWPAATGPGSHTANKAAAGHARQTANRRATDRVRS